MDNLDMEDPRKVVDAVWVKATSDAIEYEHQEMRAIASGGPGESVKLCIFAALIANEAHEHYMNHMMAMHYALVQKYPELISTRPDKNN